LGILFATGHRPNFHDTRSGGDWKADAIVLNQLGAMPMDRTTNSTLLRVTI
jgi:hypothetical protein